MRAFPTRSLASILLGALILSACAAKPPRLAPTGSPPAATPTVGASLTATNTVAAPIRVDPASLRGLKLQLWDAFSGPSADAFLTQVAQFNSNNEWGIVVYPTDYGDYTSLFDAVNAGLASGTKPDLVAALPEQALAWDASRAVVDLNPYAGDSSWGLKANASADFLATFWTQDVVEGRRLGVPAARSAHFSKCTASSTSSV